MKRALPILAMMVAFAACGSDATSSSNDTTTPVTASRHIEGTLNFDYGWVTMKCDGHGHRVYFAEGREGDVAVTVIADDDCPTKGTQ